MTERLFKVIIIGDPTVGKTSFVQRYVQDSFRRDYKGTVGVDFALKILKWSDSETIKLQLWDIAGCDGHDQRLICLFMCLCLSICVCVCFWGA